MKKYLMLLGLLLLPVAVLADSCPPGFVCDYPLKPMAITFQNSRSIAFILIFLLFIIKFIFLLFKKYRKTAFCLLRVDIALIILLAFLGRVVDDITRCGYIAYDNHICRVSLFEVFIESIMSITGALWLIYEIMRNREIVFLYLRRILFFIMLMVSLAGIINHLDDRYNYHYGTLYVAYICFTLSIIYFLYELLRLILKYKKHLVNSKKENKK